MDYIKDMGIFLLCFNKNIPKQMLYHRYLQNQYNLYYQFKLLVNRVVEEKKKGKQRYIQSKLGNDTVALKSSHCVLLIYSLEKVAGTGDPLL